MNNNDFLNNRLTKEALIIIYAENLLKKFTILQTDLLAKLDFKQQQELNLIDKNLIELLKLIEDKEDINLISFFKASSFYKT